VICFPMKLYGKDAGPRSRDCVCEVRDGKILELPHMKELIPGENWECIRLDYKFISDGTWYIEGTEAYPTMFCDGTEEQWGAIFLGWTNEKPRPDYAGELPRWDSEHCSFREFKIEKR